MENKASIKENVATIMEEFLDLCDEYLMCLSFAVMGISAQGEKIKKQGARKGQRIWIASDTATKPKFHARMDASDFIKKSAKDGYFSNELSKSLLCSIYTAWDETYRHRIAAAAGIDAKTIVAPLMGDLRKIRHCIVHDKSAISEKGMNFEVLTWSLAPGKLMITQDMFSELNEHIRKIAINAARLSPEMQAVYDEMTAKERKSFDDFYTKPGNKANDVPWPGLPNVLARLKAKAK